MHILSWYTATVQPASQPDRQTDRETERRTFNEQSEMTDRQGDSYKPPKRLFVMFFLN